MVWEYKCASIVMLTKEKEGPRVRCHRYWPDGTDMYGQTQVVNLTENQYAGYIQREFKLIDTKVRGRGNLVLHTSPYLHVATIAQSILCDCAIVTIPR